MAYIVPADISQLALAGCHAPELATLKRLRNELSAAYTVFHGVHWTREYRGNTVFGELDFVVVNRAGDVLLIEQKNGRLEETDRGLEKRYDDRGRIVAEQIRRALENVREKFKRQRGAGLNLDYLFYCPDYRVRNVNAAGIDASRIVDAGSADRLPDVIERVLTPGGANEARRETVEAFFRQSFDLVPDIHAYARAGEKTFTRLSGGLATVLSHLEMDPLRLRVRGVPGSGKSLVAQRFFERAIAEGKRPLLLCFNRPLKEKLSRACPPGGLVETWYGLCAKMLESRGERIDYAAARSDPHFWNRIQDRVVAGDIPEDWRFDTFIIDEGQDFETEWVEILRLFGRGRPDILWLEDRDQGIRGNHPVALEGFVGYRANANHRSPESIARFIRKVVPFEFEPANDLPGLGVFVHPYEEETEQPKILGRIIAELFRQEFRPDDVMILTLRGFGKSILSGMDRVGPYTLRRFAGEYDPLGNQIFTEGQVRFDSIRRFKGQQAAAVVIVDASRGDHSEIHFLRLLYTAMTRATVTLHVLARADEEFTHLLLEASY